MTVLSLDHLTAFDVPPPELVSIAAELGCAHVSLWTQAPLPGNFPMVNRDNVAETKRRMRDTGVTLHSIECFNLSPDLVVEDFRPALELGAELGGHSALAINFSDPDESRSADNFARLASLAESLGLGINVEFISMGYVRTSADAAKLIERSGVANAGINYDLLHIVRTGGSPADIARIGAHLVGYGQVCDGPLTASKELLAIEGQHQRQIPGEGEFPVADFLAALPSGTIVGVEVPLKSLRDAGVPSLERARRAVAGTRATLERVGR